MFHGSKEIIIKPLLEKGNKYNDFGIGFYCTEDKEKANEWACKDGKNGTVNCYELNIEKLNILDLTNPKYNVLNWLALLLKNRTFKTKNQFSKEAKEFIIKNYSVDTTKCDLIKGYRADDSYFSYAQDFLNNALSIENIESALKLGDLGKQIVLVSNKAFEDIKFIEAIDSKASEYYYSYVNNDIKAREAYKRMETSMKGKFILDILREKNDESL